MNRPGNRAKRKKAEMQKVVSAGSEECGCCGIGGLRLVVVVGKKRLMSWLPLVGLMRRRGGRWRRALGI